MRVDLKHDSNLGIFRDFSRDNHRDVVSGVLQDGDGQVMVRVLQAVAVHLWQAITQSSGKEFEKKEKGKNQLHE